MKIFYNFLIFGSLFLQTTIGATGQAGVEETDLPPLDKGIIYGKLKNGFTYYIKPMEEAAPEIKMTLLVRTGSLKEEPHEIDFAHHLEHLAFRETENFPEGLNSNSKLLTSLNMTDRNVHASTGGQVTSYFFNPPKGNLAALTTGLDWFIDIAIGLDLSEESIDRERGVLLQEYLAGEATRKDRRADKILESQLFPCNLSGENFLENNRTFPYQNLLDFYRKWYRPDRMAISVVGNVEDVGQLEEMIKNRFSGLKPAEKLLNDPDCGNLYFKRTPGFVVVRTDSSSLNNSYGRPGRINLFFRDPGTWEERRNLDAVKRRIKAKIITTILNRRFNEFTNVYSSSYRSYSTHTFNHKTGGTPVSAFKVRIEVELNSEEDGLMKVISALHQLNTYGVTDQELVHAKNKALEDLSLDITKDVGYWKDEIRKHFVYDEALPVQKNSRLREWAKRLTKEEVDSTINTFISGMPEDIGIILPLGYKSALSSEEKTRNIIKAAFKTPTLPYEAPQKPSNLLSAEEKDSLQVQQDPFSEEGKMDARKYILSNGATLILKQVKEKMGTGDIFFHGYTPYGASCFPVEDFYSAMYAPSIVRYMGVGEFTTFDLERFYKSSKSLKLGVAPYINFNEAGFKSKVSKEELESFLQLVYLYFTNPRKDKSAFEDWVKSYLSILAVTINPVNDLMDAMQEQTKDYSKLPYASRNITSIDSIDFNKAFDIYNKLFGEAKEFTFVVTGDFEDDEMLLLLQKYLGNLSSEDKPVCVGESDTQILKEGPSLKKLAPPSLYPTQNSYYGLKFVRPATSSDSWKEELRIEALGYILHNLVFGLRADEGLSLYYFTAGGSYNRIMERYELMFRYNCLPEELSAVKQSTLEIIQDLKSGKLSDAVFSEAMKELQPNYDPDVWKEPSKLSDMLYRHYRYGEPIVPSREIQSYLESITKEEIAQTARKYFQEKYKYEVIIENEKIE